MNLVRRASAIVALLALGAQPCWACASEASSPPAPEVRASCHVGGGHLAVHCDARARSAPAMPSADGSRTVVTLVSEEPLVVAPSAGELASDHAPTPIGAQPVSLYLRHAALLI